MKKHTLSFMLVVVVMLFASGVQAQGLRRPVLRGRHVLPQTAGLPSLGRVPANRVLELTIGLPLRNQAALDELLRDLSDPASLRYRQFLTPQQFTEQFGPTAADYQALLDYARASGFTVTDIDPGRKLVSFHAPASAVEKAFHVKLQRYRHSKEARDFFAPDAEPTLDLAVPVQDIGGLDDYVVPQPMNLIIEPASPPSAQTSAPLPLNGSGTGGSFVGNDFRKAYAPDVTLTGTGQYVGMVQFGGYYSSDILQWENTWEEGNHVPIHDVLLNSVSNITNGASTEEALDIQMQISMAPGISGIYFYRGTSIDTILTRIASDNVVRQVSASWGYGGTANTDGLWQNLVALGITFFNSSGDSDAYPVGTTIYKSCSSSYVTSVGGTTLTMSGTGVAYSSEKVWNWSTATSGSGVGSGGGISTSYALPSWQTGLDMTANLGSTTKRNIPDVAMIGDKVYVWYAGSSHSVGGTSCSAPLWAGFMALVNQQAAQNGQPPVGALNPAVYAIGKGSGYSAAFHDITSGNNFSTNSPTSFPAVAGYDLCTGWGTPKGQATIDAFAPTLLEWSGAASGVWNTNTTNFVLAASGNPATYHDGNPGNAVQFDDTLAGNPAITLNTTVTPGALAFTNNSTDYSINGPGGIAGATGLTKDGTGTVTLNTSNTFTGDLTINLGTLVLNGANALGNTVLISNAVVRAGNSRALGTGTISVSGAQLDSCRVELTGGITVTNALSLRSRNYPLGYPAHVLNVSGTNTLNPPGDLVLSTGGNVLSLQSDSGLLVLTKGMTNIASAPRYLALLGAGDGEVRGAISANGGLAKQGGGTWTLTGSSPLNGPTVLSNGTLVVNGSLTSSINNVTDAGGTLAGNGTIAGPVTVQTSGTLAPGNSVGKLTINNTLALQGTAVMEIARNGTVLTNDLVTGITTLTYGGTLIVTNVGSSPLQVGDTFQLFAANSRSSAFANIIYPAGYTFSNSLAVDGKITVLTMLVATPPTLSYSPSVGSLVFNWTGSGFKLQMQTNNSLTVGLSTNWVDVPGGGSSGVSVPLTANPTAFFRLISNAP